EKGTASFDSHRYQTVYAKRPGAVAAPTAGLHLTNTILEQIRSRCANIASVTLHVGLGTFRPIASHDISAHVMHSEEYEVPHATIHAIEDHRLNRGRILAVGTTSVRVLETIARLPSLLCDDKLGNGGEAQDESFKGSTSIFIYPPYQFQLIDC